MSISPERRKEKRLSYNWPVWFAEDYNDILTQGQMVDISSESAMFTCYADGCPRHGEHITARFSVPRYGKDESFDLENFIRSGHICRVEELSQFIRRVALQFAEPLPFKPGEIADTEALEVDIDEKLEPIETMAIVEEANERLEMVEAEAFAEDINSGTEPVETEFTTDDVGGSFESIQI